ncbi:MAG: Sua5/YciO/YrdC/YwlC family protein [Candidatus Doudnabacteria bacterium]|nr:Sua5/YciO/YrdC/YwlC family protein [Candidatus Doudnabacteria bacterium]
MDKILQAVKVLKRGGIVVYPTDTSYGLAVDALNVEAVKKLYKVKQRDFRNSPIHITVSSLAQAKKSVQFNRQAEKLFRKFLPGPLTLVLPLKSSRKSLKILFSNSRE